MSIESAKAFIQQMKTDTEFAKKMTACNNTEEFHKQILALGFDFTLKELCSLNGELSEDQLCDVAGGNLQYTCTQPVPVMGVYDCKEGEYF